MSSTFPSPHSNFNPPSLSTSTSASLNSNSLNPPPTTSRPLPYTAATVIPTLHSANNGDQAQKSGSNTGSTPSANPTSRRRAGTSPHARLTPLDLDVASLSVARSGAHRLASLPKVLAERPSSPIPIPIPPRQRGNSPPIVPLTARARSPINYFGAMKPRRHMSESLTPHGTPNTRKRSNHQPASGSPVVQRGFSAMGPRPGSPLYGYTPTSPLSPTLPMQSLSSTSCQQERRRPPMNVNLSGLPKFHPANFPTKDSDNHPPSPRLTRPGAPQPRTTRGSDAQQKLHQYQREVIANATQSSRSALPSRLNVRPDSPRLAPLRSPVDPMTPLLLDGQGDYLLAGSGSSSSNFHDGDGREIVERLVCQENERRKHPDTRSRSVSPALSPAISPAGGRA